MKINPVIYDEFKAQFFYICALLFYKKGQTDLANVLMAKSALTSNPSTKHTFLNIEISTFELIDSKLSEELLKLIMRDLTWRYSVIGNWFKFTTSTYYDNDSIQFSIKLKNLSESLNVFQHILLLKLFYSNTYLNR
jgi:hypothetical protein